MCIMYFIITNIKICLICLVFFNFFNQAECKCSNDYIAHCSYKGNSAAYCVRNENRNKDKCDYSLYEDVYEYPGACEPNNCFYKRKVYCKDSNVCKKGSCKPLPQLYTCICDKSYHGKDCSLKIEEGRYYTRGIYVWPSPVDEFKNSIIVFIEHPGDDMTISFSSTSSGDLGTMKKKHLTKSKNGRSACETRKMKPTCRHLPTGEMYYALLFFDVPYRADSPDVIMDYNPKLNSGKGRTVPGFKKYQLQVTVKDGDIEEFSKTFIQSVVYNSLKCPIQIKLRNCGESFMKPLQIERKEKTVIRSVVDDNPDCENPIKHFTWMMFKYEDTLFNEYPTPLGETSSSSTEYIIDKYEREIGLYKVKLEVNIQGRRSPRGGYKETYFDVCFVEVVKLPLSVVISGGPSRSVAFGDPILLDGSQSSDPDHPLGQQSHLRWTWKCDSDGSVQCQSNIMTSGRWKLPKETRAKLKKGQQVKVQLTLSTIDNSSPPVTAYQIITISELPQAELTIRCLKNCGMTEFKTNPRDVVYLEVEVLNRQKVSDFLWMFSVNDGDETRADEIRQATSNPSVLIIKRNTLDFGQTYTFIVKALNCYSEETNGSCEGRASIDIVVNKPPAAGTCTITPTKGYQVITKFDIYCTNFTTDDDIHQLRYEFYQTADPSTVGTLLGFSIIGEMKGVILTEGNLLVRVLDINGMYIDFSTTVNLSNWKLNNEDIRNMVVELTNLLSSGDRGGSVRMAGAIIDVMDNASDTQSVVFNVIDLLSKEHINDFSDVKLYMSTLKKVATKGVKLLESGIDSRVVKMMGRLMASLTEKLFREIKNSDIKESVISATEINDIALTMLECTNAIITSKDLSIFNEFTEALDKLSVHEQYKKGTASMVDALSYIGMAIVSYLLPQEEETVITTDDTVMWLKVESAIVLSNHSGIPSNSLTKVQLSKPLGKALQEYSDNIAMEVITLKNNPYWWDVQDRDVASDIVSLRLWGWSPGNLKPINIIPEPVDIYLNVKVSKSYTLSGSVTQPDLSDSEDWKDAAVVVHTIEGPHENSNGKLFVEFVDLQNKEFLVLICTNKRPDYELMIAEGQTISQNSPSISLVYQNISENTLHLIGIFPGHNVGEGTTNEVVHCRCSHLSFFGSSIFIAPNFIHPINDARLFLTVTENPYIFVFIVILMIFYLLVLLWTLIRDREDRLKRKVIVLEDNFPGEPYPYLIVVYTAFSIGAATHSNVGMVLMGEADGKPKSSRAHILRSRQQKVFRANADDWFLIFTPEHLGTLKTIHLWHDNSGSNPDWCCKNVKVYDLTENTDYTFEVHQWLSVWPGEYTEVVAPVAQRGDIYHWRNVLTQNILYHLQEQHIWLSIFISHPRATITKSQRLTLVYTLIMMSFLTSLMFYGLAKGDNLQDESHFEIKRRTIIIAIESTMVSASVTSMVMLCFKKSQIIVPSEPSVKKNNILQQSSSIDNRRKLGELIKDIKTTKVLRIMLARLIQKVIHGKPLIPVLVGKESSASVIRRRRFARAGWILSQIIIWVSAYLVMLYGLKLGEVDSILWATSSAFGFFYGIFVSMPLRIFTVSTVLFMYGEMCDVATFECEIENAMQRDHYGEEEFLKKLIELRSLPMYKPISSQRREELQEIALRRNLLLQHIEFLATIFFFVALLNTTGDLWRVHSYYINSHIMLTLTTSRRVSSVALEDVQNSTRLTDYLISTLIPAVYKEKWYNGEKLTSKDESLEEMGWLMDSIYRLVGVPQIRQIRVIANNCSFREIFNASRARCLPVLSSYTEDTGRYGFDWGQISKFINKPLLAPWFYQKKLHDSAPIYGESGMSYHSGGYTATLEDNHEGSSSVISDLMDNGWWDIRMRVCFTELTVYNPNTDSYSLITVIVEHLPSGAFTGRLEVQTINTSFHILCLFLFVCILLAFNIRLLKTINRSGLVHVFSSFWCLYDVIFVIVSDISTIFECIKVIQATKQVHGFQQKGSSDFFYFSNIIWYQRLSIVLWCLVLCLAPVRLLKFEPFVSTFKAVYYAIYNNKYTLIRVCLIGFIVVCYEMFVINFTFCSQNRPSGLISKFHNTKHDNSGCDLFISLLLSVTCGFIIIIIQTLLLKGYKIIKIYSHCSQ